MLLGLQRVRRFSRFVSWPHLCALFPASYPAGVQDAAAVIGNIPIVAFTAPVPHKPQAVRDQDTMWVMAYQHDGALEAVERLHEG